MRLIHQVIEDLRGLPDEEVTPMGAALEELLGGESGRSPELAKRFTEAGLGNIMASWIGQLRPLPANQHARSPAGSGQGARGGPRYSGRHDVW